MPNKDVVSWNSIIAGYAKGGLSDHAINLCREMVESGKTETDARTLASMLPAMAKETPEDISFVRNMFDSLARGQLVSWNAMIAIFARNSLSRNAVELFLRMEESLVEPDVVTLVSVLLACGYLSAFELGKRIHKIVTEKKMYPNKVNCSPRYECQLWILKRGTGNV